MVSERRSLKRLMPMLGLALVAALALSALGVASASAANPHRYSCKNVGEGKGTYKDSTCSEAGGTKAFAFTKIAEHEPKSFLTSNHEIPKEKVAPKFILTVNYYGIPVVVTCMNQSSTGTLENPTGGITGTATGVSYIWSECTVVFGTGGSGCLVRGGQITLKPLIGVINFVGGETSITFSVPTVGAPMGYLSLEKCTTPGFNKDYVLSGTFTGIVNNATSTLEFTKASSGIFFAGNPGTLEGKTGMRTNTGVSTEALNIVAP